MAKTNKITRSFNAGELSPLMDSRSDQAKYEVGAKIMENFYPDIHGAAVRRPGLEYIATQKDITAKGRSISFEHSVDDTYTLIFENQVIRIFRDGDRVMNTSIDVDGITLNGSNVVSVSTDGAHNKSTGDVVRFTGLDGGVTALNYNGNHATEWTITKVDSDDFTLDGTDSSDYTVWGTAGSVASILEVTAPYLTADLPALKVEQSADVMFITHPSYEPRRLSRTANTTWTLTVEDMQTGPFRDQNTNLAKTISVAEIAGGGLAIGASVTLEASGHTPFVTGTTAGHEPSGSGATVKSQTGALFKLVYATDNDSVAEDFTTTGTSSELSVPKGITWDFVTNGTWTGTVKLQREYNNSGIWETIHTVTSKSNKNITTSGTEEVDDAQYRLEATILSSGTAECQFSIRDTSHIGIVEITSVTDSDTAIGTVKAVLGLAGDTAIAATHRWSEGSFSNRRGWPIDVTISAEERLTFAGNISEPLTSWGSAIGDFTDFALGVNDDDAIQFTLVGTGQQNRIRWMLAKEVLVLGTVGGEHLLGASKDEEALTPTNVKAKIQTTYGSENIAAILVNQAVLFVQRGGKKIREFLYNFEADAHKADDLTVFASHILADGIVDMAFQRTPDPRLWCVRTDGQMAILTYERDQNMFSWCRYVTDGEFESVSVIYGGERSEDEIWVTVKRIIDGNTKRYIERFSAQAFDEVDEVMMLDCAKVVSSEETAQNINVASDTVRCGNGLCNSSLCGGVAA